MIKKILISLLLTSCVYNTVFADKLIFATEIIRHGERTASGDLINFPYEDSRGKGQLTVAGTMQVTNLGKQLHTTYTDTYKLTSEHYSPLEAYTRSTDFDRTLMSANAFLIGLFGDSSFAIHSAPVATDDLLLAYLKHYDTITKLLSNDPKILELTQVLQPKFERLSTVLGEPIENIDDFFSLVDTVYIRKQFNQPLPTELTDAEVEDLNNIAQKSLPVLFHQRGIGALVSTKLLDTIKNNIDRNIARDKKATKFNLYSTHDVTVAGFMSSLGIQLSTYPSYASHVSVQLFTNESSSEEYYVKFLYNNKEIKVNECQTTKCSLSEFNNLVTTVKLLAEQTANSVSG